MRTQARSAFCCLGAVALAVTVCSAAPPSPASGQKPAPDKLAALRFQRAKDLAAALVKQDYAKASEHFDAGLVKALGKDGVGPAWKKVLADIGPVRKQSEPRADGSAVLVAVEFAKGTFDLRVAFDKDDRIAGFFLVPKKDTFKFEPPPYAPADTRRESAVTVNAGGDWPLPATLTLPPGRGPFPAVVLVHGSGPNDADETIGPNKPFRDLAWGLAARGVASLRYNKRTREHGAKMVARGVVTPKEEVIDDALAAAALLRKSDKIDPKMVFLLGHSLGGYLGPQVAAADPDLAGLILLAGNSRPLEDLVVEQHTYLYSLKGELSAEDKKALQEIRDKSRRVKDPKLTRDVPAKELALNLSAAYWLALRSYDPVAVAARLSRPVLILQGDRDYQVTGDDLAGWKKGLKGKANVTFKSYPNLNHLFMDGKGKATPADYARAGHVARELIIDVGDWVKKQKR